MGWEEGAKAVLRLHRASVCKDEEGGGGGGGGKVSRVMSRAV